MPCDHFDWLAPFYDRAIRRFSDLEKMSALADLPTPGHNSTGLRRGRSGERSARRTATNSVRRLLDVGGGTGRVAEALRGQAGQIVVADLSLGMLRQAGGKDGLQPVCAYSEKLPFPDASFDRVIMVDALHHVVDQAQTGRELWRVVRPGGRIVIQEPDVRVFAVKLIAFFEKLALMRSHFLPPAKIADLFPVEPACITIESENLTAWVALDKGL